MDSFRNDLFELSPDAILIIEGDRFVDCNPAAVRMLRFPSREALLQQFAGSTRPDARTSHPADLSPPRQPDGRDSFEKAEENLRIAFERGSHTFEWVHTCADGEPLLVEVQLTVVRRGKKPMLHVVWRDIGERKRREEELHRSQRLESIGRLAGGIAHDFNNLLMVISGHADQLEDELASGNTRPYHVAQIQEAADRASALTHQLLTFSRGRPARSDATDIGSLVSELEPLLARLLGAHVQLNIHRDDCETMVIANVAQLEQLIVNLAANARDAMPEGGRIDIRVSRSHVGPEHPVAQLPAGDYVTLTVSDTGDGMSKDELDRAFDPFFTTKDMGRGTGLGLATVHAVAGQYGGHARIQSTLGQGTTVEVFLPLTKPMAGSPELTRAPGQRIGGAEIILLVEDEDAIRDLFEQDLREQGYTVISASNGQDALEQVDLQPGEIDLVITDMVMPHVTGSDLVKNLSATHPGIRVIYMSGYTTEPDLGPIPEHRIAVLQKPFSLTVLHREVRRLLDRKLANTS